MRSQSPNLSVMGRASPRPLATGSDRVLVWREGQLHFYSIVLQYDVVVVPRDDRVTNEAGRRTPFIVSAVLHCLKSVVASNSQVHVITGIQRRENGNDMWFARLSSASRIQRECLSSDSSSYSATSWGSKIGSQKAIPNAKRRSL